MSAELPPGFVLDAPPAAPPAAAAPPPLPDGFQLDAPAAPATTPAADPRANDTMRPTPAPHPIVAMLGKALNATGDAASKNKVTDFISKLLAVPSIGTTLQRLGYGEPLTQGKGDTLSMRPETADTALAAVPFAGKVAPEIAAAAKGIGPAVGDLGNAAAKAVTPKLDPGVTALARKATAQGIPIRPDMLFDNKIGRMVGEGAEKVPLSGSKADPRQVAFNRALIKMVGGDAKADRLTPDVFDKAMTASGDRIGALFDKTNIPLDNELSEALKGHLTNAARFETGDVQKVLSGYVDELQSKAVNGVIPGEAFRKLNSQIGGQIRRTQNGDLKHALGNIQDDMHEALQRNLSGADAAALADARKQYAIGKTLEPLVAKSPTGDISAAGLMSRATSDSAGKTRMARDRGGDFGDLARIGQKFVKEPGTSGTAERAIAYGLLGGGASVEPHAAVSALTLANLYNRLGPKLAQRILYAQDIQDVANSVRPKSVP